GLRAAREVLRVQEERLVRGADRGRDRGRQRTVLRGEERPRGRRRGPPLQPGVERGRHAGAPGRRGRAERGAGRVARKAVTPPVIEANGLSRWYGDGDARVEVLKGVDLTVAAGEYVSIMGASG